MGNLRYTVWVSRFGADSKLVADMVIRDGTQPFEAAMQHLILRDTRQAGASTYGVFTDNGVDALFWDWWWETQECPEELFDLRMAPMFQKRLERERQVVSVFGREWSE